MNDPFDRLSRLQGELGGIAAQLTQVRFTHFKAVETWRPAVNVYRCNGCFVLCMDLAGTDRDAIRVQASPRRLIIRGTRPAPAPDCNQPQPVQVLQMEIDHGPFERVLDLPLEIVPEDVKAEHSEGLLWVQLPLRGQ